jgi:hypothetical protein
LHNALERPKIPESPYLRNQPKEEDCQEEASQADQENVLPRTSWVSQHFDQTHQNYQNHEVSLEIK